MGKVQVVPLRQRGEILFVMVSTALILLVAAGLIALKKGKTDTNRSLKGYQISGITGLTGNNQGIFTDLYTAALDIEYYHQTNHPGWPTPEQMDIDKISPFVQDQLWQTRGRLVWREQPTGTASTLVHTKAYVGKTAQESVAGSFLVLFEHYHSSDGTYYLAGGKERPYSIWFKADNFDLPATISEGTLIQLGWKEVVSYTGKDQRKELNR